MISKPFIFSSLILSCNLLLLAQESCCEEQCCDSRSFWMGGEYLYWNIKDSPAPPPLVIEGPASGAILGDPDTKIVLGRHRIDNKWRSGGRFSAGFWLGDAHCYAFEAGYFFLSNNSKFKSVKTSSLPGDPLLSVPFFNPLGDNEASYFLSFENRFSGYGSLKVKNSMQGAEANFLAALCNGCSLKLEALLGFRYWYFHEKMAFFTSSPFIDLPNDVWNTKDSFIAINNFYGGQIGLGLDYSGSCFFFNLRAKAALGADCGKVGIHGHFKTNEFNPVLGEGPAQTYKGGLFALPTNIGNHHRTFMSLLAEANANIGYRVSDCVNLQAGYTFIYVNKALWASNQIDRTINFTQSPAFVDSPDATLVGTKRPRFRHKTKNLWTQGVNVGLFVSF